MLQRSLRENDKGQLPTLGAGTAWASSVTSKSPRKDHEHHARLLPCVWVCGHRKKGQNPCKYTALGLQRLRKEVRLRGTILWLLRPQNSVTEDGRRKGAILGVQGACPLAPRRVGKLSADSRGKAPLDLVRSVA